MVSVYRLLGVLLWKCLILRRRNWLLTFLDLAAPVGVIYLAYYFLQKEMYSEITNTIYFINIIFKPTHSIFRNELSIETEYFPANSHTNSIMDKYFENNERREKSNSVENEKQLELWLRNNTPKPTLPKIGIVFLEQNEQNYFKYKIRSSYHNMKTTDTQAQYQTWNDPYELSGFLAAQCHLDVVLMNSKGVEIRKDQGFFGEFPTVVPTDLQPHFKLMHITMSIAYLFIVAAIINDVIEEKSSGIKELMKIMGVAPWMIWVHWLIYMLIVHVPVTIIGTFLLTCYKSPVISANVVVVWLLLFLFTLNCILFLFIVTCLINEPITGVLIGISGWLIVHNISWYFLDPYNFGFFAQILFCVLPLNNLIWVFQSITSFYDKGVSWSLEYLFTEGSTGSRISVGLSIIISLLETIVLVITLTFLDGVKPGPHGVSKPITFLCQWCKALRKDCEEPEYVRTSLPKTFEPPPKGATVGIEIRGLHKRFGSSNKVVAVDNVDLDIYEGEIMVLLGHNGAGKTTTMSMITGMLSLTKGTIRFNSKAISKYSSYRDNLGVCTQHNLYVPQLTVIENMVFFGMLRGMSRREAKLAGLEQLNYLDMTNKSNSFGADLSGGMKRRLCLAVSLVGNTKYLILDEPTSGLDPESRRKIWNIILSLRGQRTILITTHFMEEADVLGDRIAIMDHGNVVCCGTTMFLKRLYGTGYYLHVLKEANSSPDSILNLIRQYVVNSQMKLISSTQTDFSLKDDSVKQFPGMFAKLEEKSSSLGITGISITCTTMEDVFLKVASKNIQEEAVINKDEVLSKNSNKGEKSNNYDKVQGLPLICVHYKMLLWKLFLYRYRNISRTVIIVIITALSVWFIAYLSVINKVLRIKQPPLPINLNIFPHYTSIIKYDNESKEIADIARNIISDHGWKVTILESTTNITLYLIDLSVYDYNKYSEILLAIQIINNSITVQYQNRLHLSAIAVNLITNILLRNTMSKGISSIEIINHPSGVESDECIESMLFPVSKPLVWFFVFSFVLLQIMEDIIPLPTDERVSGFKQQQILAGVSPIIYWMSNFTYNYCLYLCIIFIYIIIIAIVGGKVLIESGIIGLLFLVLSMYGISGIFFVYLFTLFTDRVMKVKVMFNVVSLFLGILPAFISHFTTNTLIISVFCFNPLVAVSLAIMNIASGINEAYLCKVCNNNSACRKSEKTLLVIEDETNNGILSYLLFLSLEWLLYFVIILLFEYGCVREILLILFHKPYNSTSSPEDDEDVKKECDEIRLLKQRNDENTPLRVDGLSKKYVFGTRAVIKVSFVVHPGDCFGLLGVNGAGKTTTFKMLTGEIFPNRGDAVIFGHSVITQRQKYQSCVGYCPQFDAFLLSFTGKEVLNMIGRLRGIPRKNIKEIVDEWVKTMGISEHAEKKIETYSGGTKRKLTTAIAFIGDSVVVFLDEPTSGVDPESRRKLWTVMQTRQSVGQSIVLTSHSMEECEALCTRLTIMKDGQMKCIGSSEYLKNKFSQGYTVHVKLDNPNDIDIVEFKEEFREHFPKSIVVDEHATLINYQIPDPNLSLSRLFTVLMRLKEEHNIIEDFNVSNTSMEQLFLFFAKEKKDSK